jgi:hypothetical protein
MLNTLTRISLLTPLGLVYDLNDQGFYLTDSSDGLGMAPFHRLAERSSQQHGETDLGFRLDPRIFKFQLTLRAATPTLYYARRAELLSIFRPSTSPFVLQFTLPDGSLRCIDCFLEKGLSFDTAKRKALTQEADLVLRAPDPTFYDPAMKTLALSWNDAQGLLFPFTFPLIFGVDSATILSLIALTGDWLSYPKIIITGPITWPWITNSTTGELLLLQYAISAGESVTIDTAFGYKTVKNNSNVNLINYLSTTSDLATFHLDHELRAGDNELSIAGAAIDPLQTQVIFQYYERYIGI